jgi:hypothetical protein
MNPVFSRFCGLVARISDSKPRGPELDSRRYYIFCVAVGLERRSLILVKINDLLERKSSGSGLAK